MLNRPRFVSYLYTHSPRPIPHRFHTALFTTHTATRTSPVSPSTTPHNSTFPFTPHVRMFSLSPRRADQPKTFSLQSKLPRLPVPDLDKSLEAYVKSLQPILEQKYDATSLPKEIEKRKLFAKDFASPGGLGRVLQERLKDLDHISPNNWLDDTLWLALAYHTWRAPLLINSNWWLMFAPDPADPSPPAASAGTTTGTPNPNPTSSVAPGAQGGGKEWVTKEEVLTILPPSAYEEATERQWITRWQIRRAAWIARRFAEFRTKLLKEEITPDASRAGPFCMSQYQKIFNLSRIPLPKSDMFSRIDNHATHLTLLIDDYVYAVDVFAPPQDGGVPEPLPVDEIEKSFRAAVEDARAQNEVADAERVGLLTADERDTWTKNREYLINLSPTNRTTLESISTSLMALSLDPYTIPTLPTSDPLRMTEVDAQIRNSASGIDGGRNRWFDKAVSVQVETNGRAGVMGEHSPVDALIPSIVVDYVLGEAVDQSKFSASLGSEMPGTKAKEGGELGWKRLDWVVDDAIRAEIEACQGRNRDLIQDSDASQLWWNEFGADWIKKTAKLSPDAFFQQALQLAWYADQGYATATYETASTRAMLHGRTDVIRSLSSESRAFVNAMMDPKVSDTERYKLLSAAVGAHNTLTRTSSAGHGFDRHLMGLKVHLRSGETHALFEDECYSLSQEWKLSTSGLSAGGRFMGTGFGAAWPDGYGINYLAGPYLVKFGIESKVSCPVTSTARFKHHIVQALRDMRRICETASDAGSGVGDKAKL